MSKRIIGVCGLIGSGKDTIADYLVNIHQFRRESFANSLKDAVAAVFGWDRECWKVVAKAAENGANVWIPGGQKDWAYRI